MFGFIKRENWNPKFLDVVVLLLFFSHSPAVPKVLTTHHNVKTRHKSNHEIQIFPQKTRKTDCQHGSEFDWKIFPPDLGVAQTRRYTQTYTDFL
jgi:hypothetical protein